MNKPGLTTLLMLMLSPALAQPDENVAEASPLPVIELPQEGAGPADTVTEPSNDRPATLETIVVTGELLTREADRTTSSVAVRTGAEIERSAVRDVYDIIRSTPNASWNDSELGLSTVSLRGIGSYGASMVGAGTIYGSATSIVVDGVALPRGVMGFADLSAFDLSQVEVFRGPQSTSQGRNAMAGAVIVNTLEPEVAADFLPEFRGRIGVGGDRAWTGAASLGATLWPDRLAARLVTDNRSSDGDIVNVTRDENDWAKDISHGTRLRAKIAPSGTDGPYEAVLGAGMSSRTIGNRYVLQSREQERVAEADEPTGMESDAQLYSLNQRLRLGEGWTLGAVSAWARSETQMHYDVDFSAQQDGYIAQIADSHSFSQELRASYSGEAWRGTLGLYYFKGVDGENSAGATAVAALLDAVGLCPVALVCTLPLGNVTVQADAPARFENQAVFGELDWQATSRLTLTAGLRYDRERNGRRSVSAIDGDNPLAQVAVLALKQAGVLGQDGETDVSARFSALLPKVAASYELIDDHFVGAAYTEGYRPGGDGYNFGSGRRYSFDSERTQNVELSLKGSLGALRTHYALNLFHTDWRDMQVPVGQLLDQYIDNAGRSRVRGGELELRSILFDSLRLVGGAGVSHGRFIDFVSSQGDYSGNRLPKAPEYSFTFALEWLPLDGLLLRPEVQRVGETPSQANNLPENHIDAYTLLNFSLRWQLGQLGLYFNGNNLTDEHYRLDANITALRGDPVAALGYGRQLLGGFEIRF